MGRAYRAYKFFAEVYGGRCVSLGHGDRRATLLAATLEVFVGLEVEMSKNKSQASGVRLKLWLARDRRLNYIEFWVELNSEFGD